MNPLQAFVLFWFNVWGMENMKWVSFYQLSLFCSVYNIWLRSCVWWYGPQAQFIINSISLRHHLFWHKRWAFDSHRWMCSVAAYLYLNRKLKLFISIFNSSLQQISQAFFVWGCRDTEDLSFYSTILLSGVDERSSEK